MVPHRPLRQIAGLLLAAAAGIALVYLGVRYLGTVVVSWIALAAFTAAIWAARLPPKQERMIVWALGTLVIVLVAARIPPPWNAALGAVPGVAWLWALGTRIGRR